jgi:hypothetical protein
MRDASLPLLFEVRVIERKWFELVGGWQLRPQCYEPIAAIRFEGLAWFAPGATL